MNKLLVLLCGACITVAAATVLWLHYTTVTTSELPPLRNGDIVFQTAQSQQATAIMLATNSIYTHVGVITMIDGQPHVVEAVQPARIVALDYWMTQGVANRITIKRLRNISDHARRAVSEAAHQFIGRPYDIYFTFDRASLYCSELVYYAYLDGMDISLGNIQQIADLNIDNNAVKSLIEQRWERYPSCKSSDDFEACYTTILSESLITPSAIAQDVRLDSVFTNYPY